MTAVYFNEVQSFPENLWLKIDPGRDRVAWSQKADRSTWGGLTLHQRALARAERRQQAARRAKRKAQRRARKITRRFG